ncbi:MAG: tRNA (guanosine(37)-N1)-methyltransferase TrmD [Ruminococcaceae bacterium]|nr:tRNA (guanosine(37)-N1)-methyltransferase TrmD [Oscillospiraceae bacterium]
MNFYVATLFPEQVTSYFNTSITGRGIAKGAISLECIQMRDYAPNTYGRVDDTIYGGGTGMMIRCEPVYGAYQKACELAGEKPYTVYMSPKGNVFNEKKAHELAGHKNLLVICGHYEGIDARVTDMICDEEISIGDYVLTGGETAAIVVLDAVARLVPGVLPNEEAYTSESHTGNLLEAPQYTMPAEWNGVIVPEILRNGNDALIGGYNRTAALLDTMKRRPDLFDKEVVSEEDWEKMLAFEKGL